MLILLGYISSKEMLPTAYTRQCNQEFYFYIHCTPLEQVAQLFIFNHLEPYYIFRVTKAKLNFTHRSSQPPFNNEEIASKPATLL